jgi:hypothetical protein
MDQPNRKKIASWVGLSLLAIIVLTVFFILLAMGIELLMPQAKFGAEVNAAVLMGAVSAFVPAAVGIATIYITYRINKQTQQIMERQLRQNQVSFFWQKRFEIYSELAKRIEAYAVSYLEAVEDEFYGNKMGKRYEHVKHRDRFRDYFEDHIFIISAELEKQLWAFINAREYYVTYTDDQGKEQSIEFSVFKNNYIKKQMYKDLGIDTFNKEMMQLFNLSFEEEKEDNEKGI